MEAECGPSRFEMKSILFILFWLVVANFAWMLNPHACCPSQPADLGQIPVFSCCPSGIASPGWFNAAAQPQHGPSGITSPLTKDGLNALADSGPAVAVPPDTRPVLEIRSMIIDYTVREFESSVLPLKRKPPRI